MITIALTGLNPGENANNILDAGDGFQWMRYVAVLGTSVPVTIEYCVSNVIFLWILTPVFVKKLNRVKYKYGFFKDEEVRKLINQ